MLPFELEALLRLLVAGGFGGVIGLERQIHGRPAGLRTHILVCMGATLVMIAVQAMAEWVDPGRAVAGIVTGIGFLGAGAIIKARDIVRGLTTAACIWFVAALGVIIGQGQYILGAAATALALFVLVPLDWLTHHISALSYYVVTIRAQTRQAKTLATESAAILLEAGLRVLSDERRVDKHRDRTTLVFHLHARAKCDSSETIEKLLALPDVSEVHWK
jgi:putative Mg2+ transporter-C (MgtC) family protein